MNLVRVSDEQVKSNNCNSPHYEKLWWLKEKEVFNILQEVGDRVRLDEVDDLAPRFTEELFGMSFCCKCKEYTMKTEAICSWCGSLMQ